MPSTPAATRAIALLLVIVLLPGCPVLEGAARGFATAISTIVLICAVFVLFLELAMVLVVLRVQGPSRGMVSIVNVLLGSAHIAAVAYVMRRVDFVAGPRAWLAASLVIAVPCLCTGLAGIARWRATSAGFRIWGWAAIAFGLLAGGAAAAWLLIERSPWPQVPRAAVVELRTASGRACARYHDGAVGCWIAGSEWSVAVSGVRGATALHLHDARTCAIDGDRRLWCWPLSGPESRIEAEVLAEQVVALGGSQDGGDFEGRRASRLLFSSEDGEAKVLGISGAISPLHPSLPPLRALAQQADRGCGVYRHADVAVCWDLSRPDTVEHTARLGEPFPVQAGASAIAVSRSEVCTLGATGEARCRSLFDPHRSEARTVHTAASAIEAGPLHGCVLTHDREVWCWGRNGTAQLGQGDHAALEGPRRVRLTEPVEALAVGDDSTCVVTRAGAALCWGAVSASMLEDPGRAQTCAHSRLLGNRRCVPTPSQLRLP